MTETGRRRSRQMMRELGLITESEGGKEVTAEPEVIWFDEEWVPVVMPDVAEGYAVHPTGEVMSSTGRVLQHNLQGVQLWVSLKRSDHSEYYRSIRLDKLVLNAFHGPPKKRNGIYMDIPVHLDGDTTNCHRDNLAWGAPGDQNRVEKKAHLAAVPEQPAPGGGSDDIEMLRVYRSGNLSVTVNNDGSFVLPQVEYDAESAPTLLKLIERIEEVNRLLAPKRGKL